MRRILRKLRTLFPRRRCRIERHGSVRIAIDNRCPAYLRAYQRYCVLLFREALLRARASVDVVFGACKTPFGGAVRSLHIDIQSEHTLVKPGGRDSAGAPAGQVALDDGSGRYLVRIANLDYLRTLDTIVEYSHPNRENVRSSGRFDQVAARTTVVAPLLYDTDFGTAARDIEAISLMFDEAQPRRRRFLEQASKAVPSLRNVRDVFDATALRRLYDRTRVLVNVHQTDHHDTLEELRILPALLRGVIVVSEDVPLRDRVPYHDAIIWSDYASLAATTAEVLEHYATWRARIFGDGRLARVLARMARDNQSNVDEAVRRMLA